MSKRTLKRVGKMPGVYKRGDTFYAGHSLYGKVTFVALPDATNVSEAQKAREALVAGIREGRVAQRDGAGR